MTFFQQTALMFASDALLSSTESTPPIGDIAVYASFSAAKFCAIVEEAERSFIAQQSKIGQRDLSVSIPGEAGYD